MKEPPKDSGAVEAAVAALSERLADGDPADPELQKLCQAELETLRAAYRKNPSAFSRESIETLRELGDLLRAAL